MIPNAITIPGGAIVVQSCDHAVANIGVFHGGRGIYRHVDLPALTRCAFERDRPGQMQGVEFDAVLQTHRAAVVTLLAALNRVAALPLFAEAQ